MNANILKFTKIVKINEKFSLYLYFIIFLLDCIIFISEMLKYNKTYHHLQSRAKVKLVNNSEQTINTIYEK